MRSLFEATEPVLANKILEFIKDFNPGVYNNIIMAFKVKKLDFTKVDTSKIQKLDSKTAFKYGGTEGDKYFKIWMFGDAVGFCTWANTMIDNRFNWNHKGKGAEKRIYANIIGTQPHIDGYFKSNSYLNKVTAVYMIPFTAFGPIAVDMVEDERAKFLDTKKAIVNSEFIVDSIRLFNEAERFMRKQTSKLEIKLSKLVPDIMVYIPQSEEGMYRKMEVSGNDTYSVPYSSSGIIHEWKFVLSIPELTYGESDWSGHTFSKKGSYEVAKNELKKAGVKLAFVSDCKKRIREFINLVKKNPDYLAFCEEVVSYNELKKAYGEHSLVQSLKGESLKYLDGIVTVGEYGRVKIDGYTFTIQVGIDGHSIYFNPTSLEAEVGGPTIRKIAIVKAIADNHPKIFSVHKRFGTTIPGLQLNPDIVKNLKVTTK